jgi:hypothetical protein
MSYNLSAIYGKDDNPAERLKPKIEHGKERPKLKKPFDIRGHEFSCENFKACKPSWIGDDLQIEIIDSDFTHHDALLNKDDAIAIAKALGVTGEDLL